MAEAAELASPIARCMTPRQTPAMRHAILLPLVGSRRLMERLAHERRVVATAIQAVGSKGDDGLVLARVGAGPS
jgi:hypothetical protein